MVAWLHGCMVAWLHGCMVAWLHGCMVAWLHGCMVAWLHGCIKSCSHSFNPASPFSSKILDIPLIARCWILTPSDTAS
ncbi:hypothetical protein [Nitrosomonas cryotolerans]|uniref:hypothetical protein n=1 Tax=Nitrosomonas cryotolerans TaxID=44575 RepID=UPI003CCBC5C5